jgi:hypothetical protein
MCPALSILRGNGKGSIMRRMSIAASSSTFAVRNADALPPSRHSEDTPAPKRDRRRYLTQTDKRLRFGKRIAELTAMFIAAVGSEVTPMRRLAIDKAAQLTAIAELARGDFMRDGQGSLDDIVRLERKADQAVRAAGISEKPVKPAPALLAQLAARR